MGIKKYILASIILLVAITGYVFSIESGDYRIELANQVLILPIALWVVVPAIILFAVTVLHMFYYGFKNILTNRSIKKDNENLITLIDAQLLGEKTHVSFKSDEFKEVSDILSQLNIKIGDINFNSSNKKIAKTAENIINIKNGKYISEKTFKLPLDNPLMEKNLKNRIDSDDNFAVEVIKKQDTYTQNVFKYAFLKVIENKSMTTIKKVLENITLDIEMLKALIKKDSEDQNEFSLDNTTLIRLISNIDITNKDLIQIAKEYKKSMSPEQLMKLFEDIITTNEKLTESYLYVLSEYEMIDEIREILVNSQKDEFAIYKAYLDLRDAGKHYSLDTFI